MKHFGIPGKFLLEAIGVVSHLEIYYLDRGSYVSPDKNAACDRIEIKLTEQLPCTLVFSDGFHKKVLSNK